MIFVINKQTNLGILILDVFCNLHITKQNDKILIVIFNTYSTFYVLGTSLSILHVIIYLTLTKNPMMKVSVLFSSYTCGNRGQRDHLICPTPYIQ